LAKEFKVPVVVLAQLNRAPEQRTDKKAVMCFRGSDLSACPPGWRCLCP
jgi:replicative DNA helicase